MTTATSLPHHVVIGAAAHELMTRAEPGNRLCFALRLGDLGDVGYVDGVLGRDVLFLDSPPSEDQADSMADGSVPGMVCWVDAGSVRVRSGIDPQSSEEPGVSIMPTGPIGAERALGVLDTSVLAKKCVAVLGLGSGGSFIVRELARAGVGKFLLLDDERLEVGNVTRHECGLDDVGRLKVNALRDLVARFNPGAAVITRTTRISGDSRAEINDWLREHGVDLVVCATDSRESRLLVNRMCVQSELTLLLGGVYRRAYGGLVQRVIPGLTACYQCFVQGLPPEAEDREISSARDSARYSYTDRNVAPEPGLSSDIVPVALLMAKLALLELVDDSSSAFTTLAADLVAPLYQWINRREFAHSEWEPLGITVDQQSILRWYGAFLDRRPDCAACS